LPKLSLDIMQNSKVDLSREKLTWVTNKAQVGVLATAYFSSNGFLPNSCHPNPEWKKQSAATTNPSSPPASPLGLAPEAHQPKATPKAHQVNAAPKLPSVSVPPRLAPNPLAPGADPSAVKPRSPTHGTNSQLVLSPSSDGDRAPALDRWNPKKAPSPVIFEPGTHDPTELSQVENFVWLQHGVTKTRDLSDRLPTCVSGHVLSYVEILEISDSPFSPNCPKCCVCSAELVVGNCAFTCYKCAQAYFLNLPIAREVAATGHSKGMILCPNCTFLRRGDGRIAPDISL
jgi:hypothetical protein